MKHACWGTRRQPGSQRAIPAGDPGLWEHRALTDIYLHGIDHTSWVEATDDQDQQTFSNASSYYEELVFIES